MRDLKKVFESIYEIESNSDLYFDTSRYYKDQNDIMNYSTLFNGE